MQLKPTKLTRDQLFKVGKVILYVMASGAVASLAAWVTAHPAMFGLFYPMANVIIVFLVQLFTPPSITPAK